MTIKNTETQEASTREVPVIVNDMVPQSEESITGSDFVIEDRPLDDYEKLRVAVIGSGISGINAGILLPIKVPNVELTIFEKNADVGGTWLENIYPGVRCDIPAHVYQSTFEPNTQWSQEYAEGDEILQYWQNVAKKYDVYKYVKFHSRIVRATWDSEETEWVLRIETVSSGVIYEERFDVLVPAIGAFNAWRLPDYPGIRDFEGHLRHSSNWDPNFEPTGKTIAVIGNGASGIQVLPPLQKVAKHVDHYARSPTWIAPSFGQEKRSEIPVFFSEEHKKSLEDPKTYFNFRKPLESQFWRNFHRIFKDSKGNNEAKVVFKQPMTTQLEKKPEILAAILPDFEPFCRRPTPGPGYLKAISAENVDYITTRIKRFTKTGIVTVDGIERNVDAVICATGANVDWAPPFPIIANGIDLHEAWQPNGKYTSPYAYFGIAPPLFPNLLFSTGPNSFGLSGTFPFTIETVVTYIAKVLRKIQTQGIKTIVVSEAATDDFVEYIDKFFPRTALSGDCSSWYNGGKAGQRIHGPWPGSSSHAAKVRVDPRWEDFEYTYKSVQKNRFAYFGNGWTKNELIENADLTKYLKLPAEVDLRSHHENWFEI